MPYLTRAIIALLVIALLMMVGAILDHTVFVVPLAAKVAAQSSADKQASLDAKQAIVKQEVKQNDLTQSAEAEYVDTIKQLQSAISLLQHAAPTHNEPVSAPSGCTIVTAQPVVQPRVIRQGTCEATGDDPCSVERLFFNAALMDAAAVDGYANWVKSQGFPVQQ